MFRSLARFARRQSLLLLTAATLTTASAAQIYDNGAPAFVGINITQIRAADNFTLASPDTVTDVRIYASTFSGLLPANFSGTLSYAFYNDSSGALGSVIGSGSVSGLTGTAAGLCGTNTCYTIDFSLNSALALGAGTYWLEVHEGATLGTNDGTAITWAGWNLSGSSLQSSSLATAPGTFRAAENSFILYNNTSTSAVPEPSSAVMLLFGTAGLGLLRLRKRRN
jgi:hypothetical protein